ncbi:MAG: hypothetical protein ACI4NA_01700 [Succinivibrio sp.]
MIAQAMQRQPSAAAGGFDFRRALKDCFERRQRELGLSDRDLVRSFDLRSKLGALMALRRFHRDGDIDERMRTMIQRRLGISDGEFGALFGRFFCEAYADRNCFFSNLGLFASNIDEILSTPAYSDVVFYGASAPGARGDVPVSVGELLWHYSRGEWMLCRGQRRAYIYRLTGRLSNDSLRADAVGEDGTLLHAGLHSAQGTLLAFYEYSRRHCAGPTSWTVRSLARMLAGRGGSAAF